MIDVLAGDQFLLCSDGLSGYFAEDPTELGQMVAIPDAEASVRKLIDAANQRGGKDNITAVLVTLGEVGARDEKRAEQLPLKREILARMPLFRRSTIASSCASCR